MRARMYKITVHKDTQVFYDCEITSEQEQTDKEVIDYALTYGILSFSDCVYQIEVSCLNP